MNKLIEYNDYDVLSLATLFKMYEEAITEIYNDCLVDVIKDNDNKIKKGKSKSWRPINSLSVKL